VFIFVVTAVIFSAWPSEEIRTKLNDESFRRSLTEMYRQSLDPVEQRVLSTDANAVYLLALKDQRFWNRAAEFTFVGDKVQITENRKIIKTFSESYLQSAQYQFGLGPFEVSPWAWLTYQFVHATWVHLLGNMLIIFMVLSYLEQTHSESWLAAVYLLSGFAGGISFLFFDTGGGMAVVGASAAASGLLSFLVISQSGRLMPWGYIISPTTDGYGQIYLPVFFIFPVFLVSDFSTLMWEPTGVNANVAVSAHIGGCLMGFFLGAGYLVFIRSKAASHRIFGYDHRLHKLS